MKKILSIALVALLAASAVFAGITGSASFSSGYDLDENVFSLSNPKSSDSTFSFEFDASSAETAVPESGIYAEFSGSVTANMTEDGLSVKADLKDALIKSTDGLWSVNLTKVANGVEVTYAGFASQVYYKNQLNWGAKLTTPEYAIIEGLTVSANVGYDVALNDLTDPSNWSKNVWQEGVEGAIAEARDTEAYFKKHADGTYYNATLAGKQAEIAAAKNALEEAKAAFAKEHTEDNYKAIADKTKALEKAEKNLAKAIADLEYKFMKANADGSETEWYKASTTYEASSYYTVVYGEEPADADAYFSDNGIKAHAVKEFSGTVVKDKTYFVIGNEFVVNSEYDPANKTADYIYTFKAEKGGAAHFYKVTQNKEITTYSENPEKCRTFDSIGEGTKTVNGGLTLAYAKDLFAASVAGNVKYETIGKAVGFDVTAKASYDFVKGGVSFERTIEKKNLLGANVEATYAGVTVKASVSDILAQGDGRLISSEVSGKVAGVTAKVSGAYNFGNDYSKTGVGSFTMAGEVGYAFDFVAIKAKLAGGSEYEIVEHEYKKAKVYVAPELTLTNKTLIQNAELSLAWTGAKFGGTEPAKGAVTAKISVEF